MTRVIDAKKQTENRFLNMYELAVTHRNAAGAPISSLPVQKKSKASPL